MLSSMNDQREGARHGQHRTASLLRLLPALLLGLSAFGDAAQTRAGERLTQREGKVVEVPPRPREPWSAAELALREAMETDRSYASKSGLELTQAGAIAGWQRFLERRDLSREQRAFAWWRLAALYGYNLDPTRGEKADYVRAEQALRKTRELLVDLTSAESLNSASLYGSLPGKPNERARRLAESFNWLARQTEKDIERSARQVNKSGSMLHKKFFPNIAYRESTLEERRRLLLRLLEEYRAFMADRITQEIRSSQDPEAIAELLDAVRDAADKEQMDRWRVLYNGVMAPPHPPRE